MNKQEKDEVLDSKFIDHQANCYYGINCTNSVQLSTKCIYTIIPWSFVVEWTKLLDKLLARILQNLETAVTENSYKVSC